MTSSPERRAQPRGTGPHPAEQVITLPGVRGEPLRPLTGMSVTASVNDSDAPRDVLDLLALDAFLTGREPFAFSARLENVRPDAVVLPEGGQLLREATEDGCVARFAVGEGWSFHSAHWRATRRASLVATAVDRELAQRVVRTVAADVVIARPATPERVPVGFWHLATHGPRRVQRDIEAAAWPQIRDNYPARAAAAVDLLMARTATSASGRLLLLHGPPGTGKTTLLRSLARAWRPWCQVDCVLDPELLFGNPGYLLEAALGDEDEDGAERWRLLLLEDCDELIRAEAKVSSGQALSRLLNLTDGLLGQGRNVLVAITTNEDLSQLHPAVTRPGRSLANLEIGRLSPEEALAWLRRGSGQPGEHEAGRGPGRLPEALLRDGATLAELYALRSGVPAVCVRDEAPGFGCYL